MSTRTVLYALTVAVAMLTLPGAASARPLYDAEPVAAPTAAHVGSSGPSPLLIIAAVLAILLVVVAVRFVRMRPITVKA